MGVFVYTKGKTLNLVVSITELETVALLVDMTKLSFTDAIRWSRFTEMLSMAMDTGGIIHITLTENEEGLLPVGGKYAIDQLPEELQGRVIDALNFFADENGVTYDPTKIEIIK